MAVVKILAFGGMIPATDDRLLQDTAAALSRNCYLYTGQLVGMVAPKFIRDMENLNYGKAFRIPKNYYDAEHIEDAYWMEFTSIDTDVIRSPVVGDQYDRYYWVSPLEPPRVNSLARIIAGQPSYVLGVPQPAAPLVISSIVGGVGANEDRVYITTWVTAFGEEGPPSLPTSGNGKNDATWNLTLTPPLAGDVTNNNVDKVRIYRTVASAGATSFFFVKELPYATTTFADNISNGTVSSNEIHASTDWTGPPADLLGWVTMPNGMIAGWKGSELWFSEPYRPHAWPAAYSNVVEYPIIGLGVINQTLVVCTAGYPIVATGIHPDSISMSKLASFEPCMSRGSILSIPEGVFYASPNGLVLVANGVANLVTEGLIQKDEWNNYNKIATLRATRMGSAYYAFGSERVGFAQVTAEAPPGLGEVAFQWDGVNGMVQMDDFAGSYKGMLLDNANQRIAFNTLTSESITTNVFNDGWSGETLIIRDDKLYRLDLADLTYPRDTALWRSKIFQSPDKKNFAALRVYFEVPTWAPFQSEPRDTSEGQTFDKTTQYGLVRVYADSRLIMTRELRTSGEVMRLPSGFKADYWQIEFETVIKINSVQFATSIKELLKA
jgi:hypothetical protein